MQPSSSLHGIDGFGVFPFIKGNTANTKLVASCSVQLLLQKEVNMNGNSSLSLPERV